MGLGLKGLRSIWATAQISFQLSRPEKSLGLSGPSPSHTPGPLATKTDLPGTQSDIQDFPVPMRGVNRQERGRYAVTSVEA